jgi:hypothetical protein
MMIVGISLFLRMVQVLFRRRPRHHRCASCGLPEHESDAVTASVAGRCSPLNRVAPRDRRPGPMSSLRVGFLAFWAKPARSIGRVGRRLVDSKSSSAMSTDEITYCSTSIFNGNTGAGIGASHQIGWTGVVATLIEIFGHLDAQTSLELGRDAAFELG